MEAMRLSPVDEPGGDSAEEGGDVGAAGVQGRCNALALCDQLECRWAHLRADLPSRQEMQSLQVCRTCSRLLASDWTFETLLQRPARWPDKSGLRVGTCRWLLRTCRTVQSRLQRQDGCRCAACGVAYSLITCFEGPRP